MPIVFLSDDNAATVLGGKKIYIFGAGERADELAGYMKNNGLEVLGYLVDDEYFRESRNNVKRLSEAPTGDDAAILYGMASVDRFKRWCKEAAGSVYVWWDCLWQYDESLMEKHKEDFAKAAKVYADELSVNIANSYLLGKKFKGNEAEFAYCTEGTYFNKLTASVIRGGGMVDCGAYTGDTVRKYLNFVCNDKEKVWAFEPDPENFKKLLDSCGKYPNVECLNLGVWDKDEVLNFRANSSGDSAIGVDGDIKINCKKIDDIVGMAKVGFIKMDVEGAERQALMGARDVIRRERPCLAISAYHLWDDLFELPLIIKEIAGDGYKIYLRHHGIAAAELVIYAIPQTKE